MHHHHMWGEFRHHGHGGRGGFFERGGIILVILDLLREQPRHGYDIIREMEERSAASTVPARESSIPPSSLWRTGIS